MPLTAECVAVLTNMQENNLPTIDGLPYQESRALFNEIFKTKPEDQEPVDRVEDLKIPVEGGEIPARLYAPKSDKPLPVLVHFHGGGWVIMNLDTHDGYCRQLANKAGCAVIAVEYRKAPEFKAPTAFDDSLAALNWVAENAARLGLDPDKMGVIGDSAGGNLAAAVAIAARDSGGPSLAVQILTYPAVDMTLSSPSIEENKEAPILGRAQMEWFIGHYLDDDADKQDPKISPMFAARHAGLPKAFISTCEFDPLRDEGEAYGEKLTAAGVEVECKRYDGVFHGFMLLGKFIPEANQLVDDQVAFIKKAFA